MRMRRLCALAAPALVPVVAACTHAEAPLTAIHRRALADSLVALFDSISAIHRDRPDTGVLRRLHPPTDSVQFVEGGVIETLTGDSLFRRVRALHLPIHTMSQRFTNRTALLLDADHAVMTAAETVDWRDGSGAHRYEGTLTIAVTRRTDAWVVRAYRGT